MSLPGSASESKPRKEDLLSRVKGLRGLRSFISLHPQEGQQGTVGRGAGHR